MRWHRTALAASLATSTLLVGCGQKSAAPTTTTVPKNVSIANHTYVVPPSRPVPPHGTLVASKQLDPVLSLGGADRWTVLYRTNGAKGAPTTASGTVLVPHGPAPEGGWPVVSWAHGTVGVADRCAPSQSDNLFYNEYAQEARAFLAAGYAVVATDYPGLGTPGDHPYLDGRSEGNAVVDIVPAAHQLVDSLARDWFAVGHSQGGQAVLYATKVASTRAPDFPLRATVAIAPASHLELLVPTVAAGDSPADYVYALYALEGLAAADGRTRLQDLLGPEGISRMEQITTNGCLMDNYKDFRSVPADGVFELRPAEMKAVSDGLAAMGNPDQTPVVGPVLVLQGATDVDVPAGVTAPMAQHLKDQGADVTYHEYPGRNHDQVLGPSICEQLQFLADHGGRPATGCVPYETDLT